MTDFLIVLMLLGAGIVMFAVNWPRLDAVALLMLVALPFTGVLTMDEALAGFSDPNIVLIATLFVLGEGLVYTGVAQRVGDWLLVKAGKSEVRLIVLLMVVVVSLGAVMSSTAVTAIFIPIALRISQRTGVGPGRLMMPISMAALISGMMTLVATAPNLIVNGELERHGVEGFRFFSFTPFGLPIFLIGILYMSVMKFWLRDNPAPTSSVPRPNLETPPSSEKAGHAVACFALVIALMVSGIIPKVQAALIGCLMMGLLGCIDFNSAYRAIDWKTIVLIVGMLPFSLALERTGGIELAAHGLRALTEGQDPHFVLGILFVITALLGMFISNTATAVLMAPVAIELARELGASPYPFAMIVALAASTAFMTPVSSPVNTLVVVPGRYTFGDFVKIGVPFSLIVLIISVLLVPWILPLKMTTAP